MKQKEKDLLIKINESINKEYGLDPRTPITDTQRSLREMVKNSIEQYFENLGGHETINLYELVLKEVEGIYTIMKKRGLLDDFFKRFNYEDYGGTPILGLNKPVIIGHGISNADAIKNMIILTKDVIDADLTKKIKTSLD